MAKKKLDVHRLYHCATPTCFVIAVALDALKLPTSKRLFEYCPACVAKGKKPKSARAPKVKTDEDGWDYVLRNSGPLGCLEYMLIEHLEGRMAEPSWATDIPLCGLGTISPVNLTEYGTTVLTSLQGRRQEYGIGADAKKTFGVEQ